MTAVLQLKTCILSMWKLYISCVVSVTRNDEVVSVWFAHYGLHKVTQEQVISVVIMNFKLTMVTLNKLLCATFRTTLESAEQPG